ncbi:GNAT family N-acetyltransferase [Serinicoccus marinus]|uniref:GNAT family N-acetyltransferase n=1 Tax=Serinicoccus marinus TaxID=247333 RepID=UPI0003B359D8
MSACRAGPATTTGSCGRWSTGPAAGLHRVGLEVYAFNPRTRRVYEKVGFVLEGTQREALRYADGWVDCHVMGLLASDWAARPDRGPTSP